MARPQFFTLDLPSLPSGGTLLALAAAVPISFLLLPNSAAAQSAKAWNSRGQAAESREDYDAAFEDYKQAHLKKPDDLRYKERYERLRFQAAAAHVDRGRVLKESGDLNGAAAEFNHAHEIDPGNQVSLQELHLLQGVPAGPNPPTPPGAAPPAPTSESVPPTAGNSPEVAQLGTVTGPVTLQPVSNEPITLHMVQDTKVIYQAIAKAAGLNVLFDPNYTSKTISVDLTTVSLSDALRILGMEAGTFYKAVTPNTIFVAQNNTQNRRDLDELAVQTFYLTNASQQNDANEILTAIRNLLDPSVKIYLVPSQNAIVMRATPDQLLLAQKLLADLDRARPEVVVDVAILEVNRDKARQLGITLPTSIGLTPTTNTTTSSTSTGTSLNGGTTTNSNGTTGISNGTTNLNLNQLANLNATDVAVSVSGGTVNALLTDADTRILQNPRIRATDGQKASLKIGSKIPIATGSYSSTLTSTAGLGVQTQFTYLDIGVNIDMTPTVHFDHEVTLKMKIEVSSHTSDVTISNVTEPVISQRVVEHTIQLQEGEPSILAGILTRQETRNVSGTPGLGELPFLKYLFSTQSKENQQDEVVFLLIPHIVRESVLTRLNTRPIDTGTGTAVELRHDPDAAGLNVPIVPRQRSDSNTSAANAASAMVGQLAQQAQMPTPQNPTPNYNPGVPSANPAQPTPANPQTQAIPAGAAPISLSVVPPAAPQAVGSTFQVSVVANGAHDLYALPLQLQFNPQVLQLVNVDSGDLLGRDGQAVATVHRDEGNGLVNISTSRPPGVKGVEGQGSVAVLTFKAIGAGDSTIALPKVAARNSAQANLPVTGTTATVHVK